MQAIGLAEKEARIAREKELGIYKEHKVGPCPAPTHPLAIESALGLCQGLASPGLFVCP